MMMFPIKGPLVIASHNPGKVEEFRYLLAGSRLELSSAADHQVEDIEETGATFVANALIKARHACAKTGLPALADDTGVSVDALGGAPGIRTARWGGVERDFDLVMKRIQQELSSIGSNADRKAAYVCALALCYPDGRQCACEGRRTGVLVWPPRGEHGAGLEPIFLPNGYALTYGEMTAELRSRVNARAEALRSLRLMTA